MWRYNENPVTYKHRNVDSDFKNLTLKEKLIGIYSVCSENSYKLASPGCTRLNQSFNHIVASKAQSSKHCSTSESLDSRVQCAVAHTNNRYSRVSEVNALVWVFVEEFDSAFLRKRGEDIEKYKNLIKKEKMSVK